MSSVASLKKTWQTASDDQTTQAGIRGMSPIPGSYYSFFCSNNNNVELLQHIHWNDITDHNTSVLGKTVPLTSVQKNPIILDLFTDNSSIWQINCFRMY